MAKRSRPNARTNSRANRNQSSERGQMVAMSITDIVNRRTGAVAGPTAAMQDVSSMVAKSLESLVETKKLASAAEAVKTLMAEDQGPQESPFSGLKEIGINIGDMMQFQAAQAKMAQDELHRTREQIIDEKVKVAELTRQDRTAADSLMQQMMAMQNQSFDNQMKLMTQMYEQRIKDLENAGRKPEGDPVTQLMQQISMELLKDRLTNQPPNAQDQIGEAMSLVNSLKGMFAMNGPNVGLEQELNRMKIDLELKKLDMEREERAQEREERRARAEAQTQTVGALLGQLAELVPAAIEIFKSRPATPAAPSFGGMPGMMPSGTMPPGMMPPGMMPGNSAMPPSHITPIPAPSFDESTTSLYPPHMSPDFMTGGRYDNFNAGSAPRQAIQSAYSQIICPNCGENFDMQRLENGACPRCKAQLFAPTPYPMPPYLAPLPASGSRSGGGVLEI
jgi:DNA-directed RNA polymerase subunit RPC12/RpoP